MTKHILVIPCCETNEKCGPYLHNLLTSIEEGGYFENGYEVILAYDNCSKDFQDDFKQLYGQKEISTIDNRNPVNLNFAANVNTGLREALKREFDRVTILNMDTILPPYWHFDKIPGAGLSFPNPVDDPSVVLSKVGPDHKWDPDRRQVTKFSGFCMCLSRAAIEKVGVLDEHFPGSFNDDDLAVRVALAGFPVEVVNVNVHHELKDRAEPSNTGAYDHAELGLGLEKYRRKWSIPRQVQHEQFNQWILDNYEWNEAMKCK